MYLFLLLILPLINFSQDTNISDSPSIPIKANINNNSDTAHDYRPGLNFQSTSLDVNNSVNNLIDSAAVTIEFSEVGRAGAIRIDGAATLPMMGLDGFLIRDPSINQGQILLDLLPYDFAQRVDIYKQNLVPFGVTAGSFVDFRIPETHELYTSILSRLSTTANIYTKLQGEIPFKDGTTFWGIVADFGLYDYYYATDGGKGFEFYPNSTYNRTSVISKTSWKGLEFLLSHTYTDGFSESPSPETPICQLTRNNLITGLRYNHNLYTLMANYTFYNQMASSPSRTNDYMNHQFNIQTGLKGNSEHLTYQVLGGYEFNNVEDGIRATHSNYQSVPLVGEHFFKIITELGISIFKEADKKPYNINISLALNQIISLIGKYTPIPTLNIGFRHQNGFYTSAHVSRVYVLPDVTSAYGFGGEIPLLAPNLVPKDGIKTGGEIGYNYLFGRIFANASYAWLDDSFRLSEDNLTMINTDNVTAISVEIGTEFKHIIKDYMLGINTAIAWNKEIDAEGDSPTPIPIWKWVSKFYINSIDQTWNVALSYRLNADTPNTAGFIDKTVRHYVDIHMQYKLLIFNILNLANQSYRPIPENIFSPYNPGIRAELGINYKF